MSTTQPIAQAAQEPRGITHKTFDELSGEAQATLEEFAGLQRDAVGAPYISDYLLASCSEATLRELIDFDLRTMLGAFEPAHQERALRAVLTAIDEDRIAGDAIYVKLRDCGCVIGNLMHYAQTAAQVDSQDRLPLTRLRERGVLVTASGEEDTFSWSMPGVFADLMRNRGRRASDGALASGDLLVTEAIIYPLKPAIWQVEDGEERADEQREADACRTRLLRATVNDLLLELDPERERWVCGYIHCEREVPNATREQRQAARCPDCNGVFCPDHLPCGQHFVNYTGN